jgi:hypothetical protein
MTLSISIGLGVTQGGGGLLLPIVVQGAPSGGFGALKIFVPADQNRTFANGTRWTEWRFINSVDGAKNADVWRFNGAYDDTQSGATAQTATFNRTQQIMRAGAELETAIRQVGSALRSTRPARST